MDIEKYGIYASKEREIDGLPAIVTAAHKDLFEFVCNKGAGFACLKKSQYYFGHEKYPTVGDNVLVDWQEDTSLIIKTLPRKSYFSRIDPGSEHKEQAIAANFDYVFILQSLNQDFNLRRLERYLTLAWQSGGVPVVILTKTDMLSDYSTELLAAENLAVGAQVHAVSSVTGAGINQLKEYLEAGKTIAFLGSSGVGKSSLINRLAGKKIMKTDSIRKKDGRGRHTTSHRQLIFLENGVWMIDTPGMRELGMWDVREGLGKSFSDIEIYFGQCKFNDCRHQSEPGCGVKQAIRDGHLSPERWESYLQLNAEAKYTSDKAAYLREKEAWHKKISKAQKQMEKMNFRVNPCQESFICQACGVPIVPKGAGTRHRNHCPHCLASIHVDNRPGDRASLCRGIMDPISIWSKRDGEWAIIHRCRSCGSLSSNRIAADDDQSLLLAIASKAIEQPPFRFENG